MPHGVARADKDVAGSRVLIRGSTNVFVNNTGAVMANDSVNSSGVMVITGSNSVFVNNKPLARESDGLANGQLITTGSTNVFSENS
jgi:uncharacterized Zn-binding protein involved in type VI secretion